MNSDIKKSFLGFGQDVLYGIRAKAQEHIDDAVFEERIVGIQNATAALIEANIDEERIVFLLQKYWDLRRSEAVEFISVEKTKL